MGSTERTAIVRIHRPELSPEERAARMKSIEQAAARLIMATREAKRKERI